MKDGYQNIDGILYHQYVLFILKAIQTKSISHYHNDPLADPFQINKTQEFVIQKYFWSIF